MKKEKTIIFSVKAENVEYIESILRLLKVEKIEKVYGGCKKCYGKGYATVRCGYKRSEDFGGESFESPVKTNIHYCSCDRGKQLKRLIDTKK